MSVEDLLKAWDGEELVVKHDAPTGGWILVAVHSTRLGPAGGGTRMRVYPGLEDAVTDALRLSSAMSVKMAVAGLSMGGGKAVLSVPEVPVPGSPERRDLMLRYADVLRSLGGTYRTACDMNTTPEDMDVISERFAHTYGRSPAKGGPGSSAPATGIGVYHGLRAAVKRAFGSDDLANRRIAVQGAGGVGGSLLQKLSESGAHVIVADVDAERARHAAEWAGGESVPADQIASVECDVFSPNAIGAVLNAESIPKLRCRVVAGGANNQLETPEDAQRLQDAGILYAPDFVLNAGGVLVLVGYEDLGWDEAELNRHLEGIADTLNEVFDLADGEGITTDEAALRIARARIQAGPKPPD